MKCEKCNEREATVLFKQTVNGETTTAHLCAECAAKMQSEAGFSAHFPFGGNLFGDLFGITSPAKSTAKKCEGCGATFADIRRAGKVCCPACYKSFAAELEPTIHSLYGKAVHVGRAPAGHRALRDRQNKLSNLKNELREAIAAERFEDAAALRDEIKALEKEEN
ncbi:MAG: hypothetical protein E7624_09185 [Ruminococcaceae bacterium]|nr:hypothetical protein [Oscillospiraceae bacterium]